MKYHISKIGESYSKIASEKMYFDIDGFEINENFIDRGQITFSNGKIVYHLECNGETFTEKEIEKVRSLITIIIKEGTNYNLFWDDGSEHIELDLKDVL